MIGGVGSIKVNSPAPIVKIYAGQPVLVGTGAAGRLDLQARESIHFVDVDLSPPIDQDEGTVKTGGNFEFYNTASGTGMQVSVQAHGGLGYYGGAEGMVAM